jgi:RNA polymerase sigma factor (TIGR02999 family)
VAYLEIAVGNADNDAAGDVTRLLHSYADGNADSFNELIGIIYQELKAIAGAQLRRSEVGRQFETTMLVHEAYEKLVKGQTQHASDRRHFFAIAARAMRQIVVDTYRADRALKRGAGLIPEALATNHLIDGNTPERLLHFDQAMARLEAESAELAELVDLSCFCGLPNPEIARLTDTNVRTIQRKLARAQAWIGSYLDEHQA